MQKMALAIEGIVETRARAVRVVLAATGKLAWVPRGCAEWYRGRVVLPLSIAERIVGARGGARGQEMVHKDGDGGAVRGGGEGVLLDAGGEHKRVDLPVPLRRAGASGDQ